MGKYLLFHRHHVVKLLLWIGMEGGDIHYVIECASCCSQCCFQVFKSKLPFTVNIPASCIAIENASSGQCESLSRHADLRTIVWTI